MSSSNRKWFRDMVAYATEIGIEGARVEFGGRHPRIVGTFRGKEVKRTFANTPSDKRFARVKARRDLERAVGL